MTLWRYLWRVAYAVKLTLQIAHLNRTVRGRVSMRDAWRAAGLSQQLRRFRI